MACKLPGDSPDWQGPGWYRYVGGGGTRQRMAVKGEVTHNNQCGTWRGGYLEDPNAIPDVKFDTTYDATVKFYRANAELSVS